MIPVRLMFHDEQGDRQWRVFMPAVPREGDRLTLWQLRGGGNPYRCASVEHYVDLEAGTTDVRVHLEAANEPRRRQTEIPDTIEDACRFTPQGSTLWCTLPWYHPHRNHHHDPEIADRLEQQAVTA